MPQEEKDFNFRDLFLPLTNRKAILWIIIIGFITYFNMLFNGFVWDDLTYIIYNPQVHTINIPVNFSWSLFNSIGQYRPLTSLYFSILYFLFKENTFFYHFLQLSLHVFCAILLFKLFNKFFNKNISLFLSLIFLIHPMQVESVSYISAASSELFFLFGISAFFVLIKNNINKKNLFIFNLLLLLSLFIKESGIQFIALSIIYVLLFKKSILKKILMSETITIFVYLLVRFSVGKVFLAKLQFIPIASLNFTERLLNMPSIFYYYLKTFIFPSSLVIDQQWIIKTINFNTFFLPVFLDFLFIVAVIALGVYSFRKSRRLFLPFVFFTSWFLIGIGLYLQIFPLDGTVADRWFYFPIVGLIGMIGIFISILELSNKLKKTLIFLGITFICLLSIRTIIRNSDWLNGEKLYLHDSKIQTNFDMENNLGNMFNQQGNYSEAILHFKESINLQPLELNYFNLGYVYEEIGNIKKANEYYSKALQAPSEKSSYLTSHNHNENIYINYTRFLLLHFNAERAINMAKEGLKDYPTSLTLWQYLALGYYKNKDYKNALTSIQYARSLQKDNSNSYLNMIYDRISNRKNITLTYEKNSELIIKGN